MGSRAGEDGPGGGEGVPVKSFPPISFKITIQGVEAMQYRIETKDAFQIVGVSVPLSKDMEEVSERYTPFSLFFHHRNPNLIPGIFWVRV